jgi:hypothetical protein
MWLDSRRFEGKRNVKKNGDFVLINDELEEEYDDFARNFLKDDLYIPERNITYYFFQEINEKPPVIYKFGKVYFKLTHDIIDHFFVWMEKIYDAHVYC